MLVPGMTVASPRAPVAGLGDLEIKHAVAAGDISRKWGILACIEAGPDRSWCSNLIYRNILPLLTRLVDGDLHSIFSRLHSATARDLIGAFRDGAARRGGILLIDRHEHNLSQLNRLALKPRRAFDLHWA